jgi:serine/threonine-protein kinase
MYEMLTGKPPYDGDSPVAIAIQHINSTPTPPRQVNPSIPLGLQQITLHAMCSDLGARYSSATAMIEDLEALRKNPQVVFRFNAGPGGTTTYVDTRQAAPLGQQTQPRPQTPRPQSGSGGQTGGARPVQNQAQRSRVPADSQQAARQKARTMAERSVQQAGGRQRRYEPEAYDEEDDEDTGRSSRVPIIIVSVLLVAVLIAAVVLLRSMMGDGGSKNEMIEVPSFLGQRIEDVVGSELYPDLNLVEGEHVYSDKYAEGEICDQSVARGKKVVSGTTIRLSVSRGPQTGSMPDLSNYTQQ